MQLGEASWVAMTMMNGNLRVVVLVLELLSEKCVENGRESFFLGFFWTEKADSFEYHHECEKDNLFSARRTNNGVILLDSR